MRHLQWLAAAAVGTALLVPLPAGARTDKTENIRLIDHVAYAGAGDMLSGGTEIAAGGRFLYAAQMGGSGGVHVFDVSERRPRTVGFLPFPGSHVDVEVIARGLLAVSAETGPCTGVMLVDVSRPRRAAVLSRLQVVPHGITVYPGKPVVYVSGGGIGRDGGRERIIDASDPEDPEVTEFTPNPLGCHDVAFHVTEQEQLAICVGGGEGQVWDVSDALAPRTIAHVPVPGQVPHSIAISPDGRYFVVGEESAGECAGPGGMMLVYDLAVRTSPRLVGTYESPYDHHRPDRAAHYCSPHFSFLGRSDLLVSAWGLGGVDVVDLSDPSEPEEVAHYVGYDEHETYYWSAEYHRGRIWASDRQRGLDVLELL